MERLARTKDICKKNENIILHIHGGGYVTKFKRNYHRVAGYYSEVSRGMDVYSLDYRVAPENPYPAALNDAEDALKWLEKNVTTADHIILGGDSAGAGLAIALTMKCRDMGVKLPKEIIAMSPWGDLAAEGKSYEENKEIDPVFGGMRSDLIYKNPYFGKENPRNPYISPCYGDFTDFPPMLIQSGTDEMLLSDSETIAQKMRDAGGRIRFTKYEGMFHVFQMAGKMMDESARAWAEVGKFIDTIEGLDE